MLWPGKMKQEMYSTIEDKINNSNYIKIRDMDFRVVKLILEDLMHEPDDWFEALEYITNENPVPDKHLGNIKKMSKDWIKWGKKKGII